MHLNRKCTDFSNAAISGIKESTVNLKLLCKKCVENNERDNFIRNRALASLWEKLATLDVRDKLKNKGKKVTDSVNRQVGEAMKTTCEKVEQTYAAIAGVERSTETGNVIASQKIHTVKTSDIR